MKSSKKKAFVFICLVFALFMSAMFLINKRRTDKMNVVLITIDSLRSDHLHCYGYKRDTSPNIDKFAKNGVLFLDGIAQSTHTPPSMTSILTSTFPYTHQVNKWGSPLSPSLPNIAKILKSNGYKTIFIGGSYVLGSLDGFASVFNISYTQGGVSARVLTDTALRSLSKNRKDAFFLWIHYWDAHNPYNPLKPNDTLYLKDVFYDKQKKLPIVKKVANKQYSYGYKGILDELANEKGGIDNPDYYVAMYDGAIRTIDQQIKRVVDYLKAMGLDKKTLIIISSDHGEMLVEHNYYFGHGEFVYEPLIRVPLIIKCEDVLPRGRIINTQVSAHIDLMPTILDILKIEKPPEINGVSLLPLMSGNAEYTPPYVFADTGFTDKCIRCQGWKLICRTTDGSTDREYELYNLKEDPGELSNLITLKEKEFKLLSIYLEEWLARPNSTSAGPLKPIDEKTKSELTNLGYLH